MSDQFSPDPQRVRQVEIDLNRRTVSAHDPYLKRMGLFTNDRMVANEIAYAEQTEAYSELGYWTTKAERNYFLTARPTALEAFQLLYRHARNAPILSSQLALEILEYVEDSEQTEALNDWREYRTLALFWMSPEQETSLRKAPELQQALAKVLVPVAAAQGLLWPMNPMQLRVLWRMLRLCEDERAFSWECLQDVCSSSWFLSLERRPKKSGVF
ncbi:MAG: hypothetical protein RJQ01_06905 [Microcella sp.]|uniref:hypothetical protein n=1 Tax=Microcella sp. TaxID=1913979 RepID=UPI00331599DB